MVYVQLEGSSSSSILVPKFLAVVCSRLSLHLGQEGIFRKSGSSFRQRQLRESLESASPESWADIVDEGEECGAVVSALDLAGILKQWLRELPEPLIPKKFQTVFIE
jgi:hypothetical protein